MKKTIIIGTIEFLNRKTVIHSIDEVYQADTQEELVALTDTFDQEGKDWFVLHEDYLGVLGAIEFTPKGLLDFIWGREKIVDYE